MGTITRQFLTFLLLVLLAVSVQAQQQRLSLPPLPAPPTLDGVVQLDEWKAAAHTVGFVETTSAFLEPRAGEVYLGYDAQCLYLATVTELPENNQLITSVLRHDANTCLDDSIELWLDPYRANRLAGTGDQRYFQMIVNSAGVFLDTMIDPTKGVPNDSWDVKGQTFKSSVDKTTHRWHTELALPWAMFGITDMKADGREIGMMLARNWKSPWVQARAFTTGGFGDWKNYMLLTLDPAAPIIREQQLGDLTEPRIAYQVTLTNPGKTAQTYKLQGAVNTTDMPAVRKDATLAVAPGATETFLLDTGKGYLHLKAEHPLALTVTSQDGTTTYFQRKFALRAFREKIWQLTGTAEEATGYFISYYPSTRTVGVKVDVSQVDGAEKYTAAATVVLDKDGKTLATQNFALVHKVGQSYFVVPNLPNGTYTVRTKLIGGPETKPLERTFVRKHFPWERSVLGITDQVFAPFTPVTTQGQDVNVVLRTYRMNGFGLWDRVVTKGKDILAAPMTLEYATKQGAGRWTKMSGRFTDTKPALAAYEAQAEAPAVKITARTETEYDGCAKVTMTLAPGAAPAQIEQLCLAIPLKDAMAPLWHMAVSGSIRANPTGAAPAGNGLIWDSTQTGNGAMLGNFLPYIWLGGPERGVCWFADNDTGWVTDDAKPAMTLTREKGQLTLRIYFINTPVTLTAPRTLVFGLQASPTKPLPADWRAHTNVPMHGGSNGYWGIYPSFAGKYPADNDYSFPDAQLASRIAGIPDHAFVREFLQQKVHAVSTNDEWIKNRTAHFGAGMNWAANAGDNPVSPYFEEHYQDQTTPEFVTFQDEWGVEPFTKRVWETKPENSGGAAISFPRSYQDFALWHALQWYTRGFGLYCDNTFPRNTYNADFSDAFMREDGQVQPSSMMWELREYHKRLWVLEQQCKPLTPYPLMISLHMTNGNILPIVTWGDINLDNEWSWNAGNDPFPTDVLQTEMIGLQAGSYPHALYPLFGPIEKHPEITPANYDRAEWGMRITHEIICNRGSKDLEKLVRAFGYGTPGVESLRYWDHDERTRTQPAIAVAPATVKWIGLWKPATRELLVVVVNWTKEKQTATPAVTAPKGVRFTSCTDAETGAAVPAGLELAPWGVRVLKYAP